VGRAVALTDGAAVGGLVALAVGAGVEGGGVAGVLAAATPGVAVLACAVAPAVAATTVEDDGGEVTAEPPLHAATMTATIGPTIQLIRMRMASSAGTRCRQRVGRSSRAWRSSS
jgi:hypothetical protein